MRGREVNEIDATSQMSMPYGRVFFLHILILAGAFLAGEFGTSLAVLVLFVIMKTAIDIMAYVVSNSLQVKRRGRR